MALAVAVAIIGLSACSTKSPDGEMQAPTATVATTQEESPDAAEATTEAAEPPTGATAPEPVAEQRDELDNASDGNDNQEQKTEKPIFILIVGSDGRNEYTGNCWTRSRADAIHVLALNPKTGRGTILNIPRDSWVSIPGRGYARINEALTGSPALLRQTVMNLTGLPIRGTIVTTFCGLIDMVNAVGGITADIPRTINGRRVVFQDKHSIFWGRCSGLYDKKTGTARTIPPGRQTLTGCEALYVSRIRYTMPAGDFDRTTNQAIVLKAGLARFQKLARTREGLIRAARALQRNAEFSNLTWRDLLALAELTRTLKIERIGSVTLRGTSCWKGSASVICLSSNNDGPYDAIFRDIKTDGVVNRR